MVPPAATWPPKLLQSTSLPGSLGQCVVCRVIDNVDKVIVWDAGRFETGSEREVLEADEEEDAATLAV